MWSFEGEHRKKPNVSLCGASKIASKTEFLEKVQRERIARETNKRRETASIKLQAFVRGCMCRGRVNQLYRDTYDDLLASHSYPIPEDVLKSLCLQMINMYRSNYDAHRVCTLCSVLVRHPNLLQMVHKQRTLWVDILVNIIHLALDALIKPPSSPCSHNPPNHAGPLRLLEILTQPKSWSSVDVSTEQIAQFIFTFLSTIIKRGFFNQLIQLLVNRTPEIDEPTHSASSLATSFVSFILYPTYIVYSCYKSHEPSASVTMSLMPFAVPWLSGSIKSQCASTIHTNKSVKEAPTFNEPASGGNTCESDAMEQDVVFEENSKPQKRNHEGTLIDLENETILLQQPLKRKLSNSSSSYVCYAFGSTPVYMPSSFVSVTLTNLVEQILANCHHSQVYNYLLPCMTASKLLLVHPSLTHSLIQTIDGALNAINTSHSRTNGKSTTYLVSLLTLIPINTDLPMTTLQLYLKVCSRFARESVQFLPNKLSFYSMINKQSIPEEQDPARDVESSDSYDDDDEEEQVMDDDYCVEKSYLNSVRIGEWCLNHMNSPEYVSWLLNLMEDSKLDTEIVTEFCGLAHSLLTSPCLSLFQCRLVYGMVGRQNMLRAMWSLLNNMYPTLITGDKAERRQRGNRKLIDLLIGGVHLEPKDRDGFIPVLATFVAALTALLATQHDSELVASTDKPFAADTLSSDQFSSMSVDFFTVSELIVISATLRDLCIGLAELSYPDIRASNFTDASYKPVWDHCFKSCVDVVRQLHQQDTRRQFCPAKHWHTSRISLPDLEQTEQYKALLSMQRSRRSTFMPGRFRSRRQLLAEGFSAPRQFTALENIRATILKELPFVFPFRARAEMFMKLVQEVRELSQSNSGFNLGPIIRIKARRSHLYEDAFDKLSVKNEPNLKLALKVQLINEAGVLEAGADGGGLSREFLSELLKTAFDPNRGFFLLTRDNTLYPNPSAYTLQPDADEHYFFIGRMLGKALFEKLLVEIPLAGFFLSKLVARKGFSIEFHHLDSLDPELCRNLLYLKTYKGDVLELGLDFTVLTSDVGNNKVIELIPNGTNIPVTDDNKIEYIYRMADFKLNKHIARQCQAFRRGLFDIVSAEWLHLFDWRELQTMISGSSIPINISDMKASSRYAGEFSEDHPTIVLFWNVVEEFTEKQRSLLLKFVTSCSRPPLLGFKNLAPPFCIQPSTSDDRLPTSSTCMNLLKLPKYSDKTTLKQKLIYAITSNTGFELS